MRRRRAHPNVGGLVSATQYSDGTWIYCSGTLISPTVFLTVAHCAEGDRVQVTFEPAYQAGDKAYAGTFHADPAYPGPTSDPHDVAVVVLDKAVKGITPALLPRADSLSGLSSAQQFTSVGYGAYEVTNSPGGHQYLYDDVRMVATGTLNSLDNAWLRISVNPPPATAELATATRAARTSWARRRWSPASRSPATPSAGRRTSTTGWTRRPPGRSWPST